MKFYTTPYHSNLIKDKDRLSVFFEGIDEFFYDNMDDFNNYNNHNNNYNNHNNNYNNHNNNNNNYNYNNNLNNNLNIHNGFDLNFKHEKLGIALDIGCGSGVLSYFASKYFDHVIAIDIDSKIIDCAKRSFDEAKIENVTFINEDASLYQFDEFDEYNEFNESDEFADLIICEMMDTALIDEEEVPVLKNVRKYLKKDGKIIPQGIINIAEPVYMEKDYIHYEDEDFHGKKPKYKILGKPIKFVEFDFLEDFGADFETIIDFTFNDIINSNNNSTNDNKSINNGNDNNDNINKLNDFNGIKITTFTKINENIICGPTPMLNPPLFIPVDTQNRIKNKKCSVKLEYSMGKGVENIKTSIIHKNIG